MSSGDIQMVYCSECGRQNEDDARFCTKCGAPLDIAGEFLKRVIKYLPQSDFQLAEGMIEQRFDRITGEFIPDGERVGDASVISAAFPNDQ